jgi:hypothetical protein
MTSNSGLLNIDQPEFSTYTHDRRRFRLIWTQEFPTRDEAINRERQIKGWSRRKKLSLAAGDWEQLSRDARGPDRSHRHAGPSTPPALSLPKGSG